MSVSVPTRGDEDRKRPAVVRWPVSPSRSAGIIAASTWLLGLLTVVSAVLPGQRDRVHYLTKIIGVPTEASATATAVAATLGLLLIWLAYGLRRRKRRAWRAAVVVTAVVALSHIAKGLDFEEAAISLALLVLLVVSRREFYALGDPVTRWMALRVFIQFVLFGVVMGIALLVFNQGRVVGRPSVWTELRHVLLGLVGIRGPLTFTSDRVADITSATLLGFGVLTAFTTAYLILRPPDLAFRRREITTTTLTPRQMKPTAISQAGTP